MYCCDSNGEFTQCFWKLKVLYSLKENRQCTNTHVQKSMVSKQTNIQKLINIFIQCMVKYKHAHSYAWSHACLHVYIYICACVCVYTYIHMCVCVREKERERERDVCVCVWETECLPLFIAMCLEVHKWTYLWDFFLSLTNDKHILSNYYKFTHKTIAEPSQPSNQPTKDNQATCYPVKMGSLRRRWW